MTKNEALKAAIDGKKIRCLEWPNQNGYAIWNGEQFVYFMSNKSIYCVCDCEFSMPGFITWEIVPEYVDFAEAWKAYDAGKTIKSEFWGSCDVITKNKEPIRDSIYRWCFTPAEIRGKWLILEDK